MKSKPKKSGFTLIELLVVVGIFTLIIGASFTLLSSGRLSANLSEARIQTSENARLAMEQITRELRLSHSSKGHISNAVGWATNLNNGIVINFQIPVGSYDAQLSLNLNNELQWGWGRALPDAAGTPTTLGYYIAYSVDGNNQLLRSTYTAADGSGLTSEIIARHISSLTFSRTSTSSQIINITIVGQRQTAQGPITQTLNSRVKLRN